jgi:glyoxylase-like metal-dependent hydrolase (beta-lactamase superfamily II)
VTTGQRGPQLAPFTADPQQALASLGRLEDITAHFVLPGHGDAWMEGVQKAASIVRAAVSPG